MRSIERQTTSGIKAMEDVCVKVNRVWMQGFDQRSIVFEDRLVVKIAV